MSHESADGAGGASPPAAADPGGPADELTSAAGSVRLSRRAVLAGGGALIVSFSLRGAGVRAQPRIDAALPGSLRRTPWLDAWIRIDAHGQVTIFTGKAELGQGIKSALIQVAAEELAVRPGGIRIIMADTSRTPNEGYTAGSHSMQDSGTALMNAAAQAREILVGLAARRLGVPANSLSAADGAVAASDGRRIAYGALVAPAFLHVRAQPQSRLRDPSTFTVIGKPFARVDIPAKVTGGVAFVQDLLLPGMVHARVVRPPSYGARLQRVETRGVEKMAGVLKVVHDGSYLAVVAEREYQAIAAMRSLAAAAHWHEGARLPEERKIFDWLRQQPAREVDVTDRRGRDQSHARSAAGGARTRSAPAARPSAAGGPAAQPSAPQPVEATYRRAYQMHASIGPSCAVAQFEHGRLTVWTHSQGVYPLRSALAQLLRLPEDHVHCIHKEGAGCYGHNGADDAAADAALIAHAFPGRPVRVQWMREQENGWEPYGSAMLAQVRGAVDERGNIVEWDYDVWSMPHSTRPGGAARLMPAWSLKDALHPPPPRPIPLPDGGGDRNALPPYKLPDARIRYHFVPAMPLRVSALRSLGAYMNVFAIESFIDELAQQVPIDPVQLRLRHLEDPRGRYVISTAAERFGWSQFQEARGRGRGFAYARYKNSAAYVAIAVEVSVAHETGEVRVLRAVAAIDSGQAVSPDGIRNQVEGGIIQAASWTLYEAVAFDRTRVTSTDWGSYPIMRFASVPGRIEVHVIDRPDQPFLGTGEAAQGPAAAAIANAVADASGTRVREVPMTAARVKAAIGV